MKALTTMSSISTPATSPIFRMRVPKAALDEHVWANVDELIEGISRQQHFDMAMLEEIVATDDKQRYSFNEDKTLIRANQGHSVPVNVELEQVSPPKHLYHGTGEKYVTSIEAQGLSPKSRLYVHLSPDYNTAEKVGSRHGRSVILSIKKSRQPASLMDFVKHPYEKHGLSVFFYL